MLGYAEAKCDIREATPMKVTVTIHKPNHQREIRTIKVTKKHNLKLRKPKGDDPGWKPHLEDIETRPLLFGRAKYYADVWQDAEKTWLYDASIPTDKQPKWTKEESTKFIRAKILERAGEELKDKSSAGIWIIAILVIAMGIINFLLSSGRIRL